MPPSAVSCRTYAAEGRSPRLEHGPVSFSDLMSTLLAALAEYKTMNSPVLEGAVEGHDLSLVSGGKG